MSDKNVLFNLDGEDNLRGGPVVCLGRTFVNNDERRAYFRDELRKLLPSLRKEEGFPLGSDDDIINLSDPPYYTACPNPWTNDFIEEWEKEKATLKKEGLRDDEFSVTAPYSSDISEGKNNPIYNAHSYHTKVPHPAIMRYILHYTQPGDIIYDGFAGTGMTGVAATICGHPDKDVKALIEREFADRGEKIQWGKRHAIQSDISPVASLICANYNSPLTDPDILDRIESIIEEVEEQLGWLYKTKDSSGFTRDLNYMVWSDVFICPNCGEKIVFYNAAVDPKTGLVSEEFKCPRCGSIHTKQSVEKSMIAEYDSILNETISIQEKVPVLVNYSTGKRSSFNKPVSEEDLQIVKKAEEMAAKLSVPHERMIEGSEGRRNDRSGLTHVHHFYFPRTLIIFERILSRCNDKEARFLLNSQLINISKLNRYRPGVSFPYNPLSGTLYIGSQISEANVFVAIKNKLSKLKKVLPNIDADNLTGVASATKVNIGTSTIDYVFTDPPFGANISYSELNFLQESWLRVTTDNKKEAIVNASHGKALFDYQTLMTESLKEYYRVLKPGGWLTMEFSNTSAAVWNSIQNALQGVGFVVANVAALDKQQGSFKAVTTPTAVKQDLIITCYKPDTELIEKFESSQDTTDNVWDFVDDLLLHLPVHIQRNTSTAAIIERSPKILYDRLIAYYVQHNYPVPMNAAEFQAGLREHFVERDGMFFTVDQVIEYEDKKAQTPDFQPLSLFIGSEADGIQWLKTHLMDGEKTYAEILPHWMQDMVATKKGDEVPELMKILEENFIKNENGAWRNPDPEKEADLEIARNKKLLAQFAAYVEMASRPQGRIREARLEALRAGFKDCYKKRDFATIMLVGGKIPESLLTEDDVLLQYYDIASMHV